MTNPEVPPIGAMLERGWREPLIRYEVLAGALLLPVLIAGKALMLHYVLFLLLALGLFAAEIWRVLCEDRLLQAGTEGLTLCAARARKAQLAARGLRAALVLLVLWVLLT